MSEDRQTDAGRGSQAAEKRPEQAGRTGGPGRPRQASRQAHSDVYAQQAEEVTRARTHEAPSTNPRRRGRRGGVGCGVWGVVGWGDGGRGGGCRGRMTLEVRIGAAY